MKKRIFILFAALLLLSMAVPASVLGKSWATCSEYTVSAGPSSYQLLAGQTIDVGTVTVSDDGSSVTVQYNVNPPWYITETHVAVADTCAGIPQTKKGNLIPGKFPEGDDDLAEVGSATYVLELPESWSNPICIAAHAVVVKKVDGEVVQEETAWSGDEEEGNPSIDVEVLNGCEYLDSWADDDTPTGHEGVAGLDIWFKYIVENTGDVTLTGVTLIDDVFGTISIQATLSPGEVVEIVEGPFPAIEGQYESWAVACGDYNGTTYCSDPDYVYYFGN